MLRYADIGEMFTNLDNIIFSFLRRSLAEAQGCMYVHTYINVGTQVLSYLCSAILLVLQKNMTKTMSYLSNYLSDQLVITCIIKLATFLESRGL